VIILNLQDYHKHIDELEYHGTTSVLCEIDKNPYSWIYLPIPDYQSHRIICTGNFANSNNANDITSATIEFTDYISQEDIIFNLKKIPYNPKYIEHRFTEYTYPIQNVKTRRLIDDLKSILEPNEIYLLGRFAEWEYYNIDAAMGAAIDLSHKLLK